MLKYYLKQKKRNIFLILLIMILTCFITYKIYYHFQNKDYIHYNSKSLDVTFHSDEDNKIKLLKYTPVNDNVGLSSKPYIITIKNNLTEKVNFDIKILDDLEMIDEDNCNNNLIDKHLIHISIKEEAHQPMVFTLDELENNLLYKTSIKALEEKDYSIRLWTVRDENNLSSNNNHYHGLIRIVEESNSVAKKKD